MEAFAASKLQEAVYTALETDGALKARVNGIYDEPQPGATLPYVSMGDTRLSNDSLKDISGAKIQFDIVAWSNEASQMEAKELMQLIVSAIGESNPALPGFDLLDIRLQNASIVRQFSELGRLYRGTLSYIASVYEA